MNLPLKRELTNRGTPARPSISIQRTKIHQASYLQKGTKRSTIPNRTWSSHPSRSKVHPFFHLRNRDYDSQLRRQRALVARKRQCASLGFGGETNEQMRC